MKIKIFAIALLFLEVGCATSATNQVDVMFAKSERTASNHFIKEVPFVKQSAGHCGPATLAMALKHLGADVSVEDLISQVYTPKMKGSLQTDMIGAARRKGFMAIPIKGFEALRRK